MNSSNTSHDEHIGTRRAKYACEWEEMYQEEHAHMQVDTHYEHI